MKKTKIYGAIFCLTIANLVSGCATTVQGYEICDTADCGDDSDVIVE